ncbi:MAG: hypothetical protein Q4A16_07975 [Lautropia sp.]|nr:hypothetical protein [Lautropia sp.]
MAGMDERYLKELEQFLLAEEEMARQGVDLLADPEYRTLRELYIDGEIDQEEFLGRIEALAASRPDEGGVSFSVLDEAEEALLEAEGGESRPEDVPGDDAFEDEEDEEDEEGGEDGGLPPLH